MQLIASSPSAEQMDLQDDFQYDLIDPNFSNFIETELNLKCAT